MGQYDDFGKNFDEDIERFLRKIFGQRPKFSLIMPIILIILIGTALFSSYYTVQPDEEAVVLRLGRYLETRPPGLNFKLPFGIDQAIKLKTRLVLQEEFGFRTASTAGKQTRYIRRSDERNLDDEALMLTGDLNVADVEWVTQFQISDPRKFLFRTRDPIANIRDISEAIMRRVVGDRLVTDVLTIGRIEIADEAKRLMQEIVDKYEMGVYIRSVKLQDVNPPEAVKDSFNEVNSAKQEQEQVINQAERKYNEVIPKARGSADQEISKAEGYASALINRAEGDANRFQAILKEYLRAPKVTRDRLYLESMEKVISKMDNVTVIDPEVRGVLPIFQSGQVKNESK